MYVHQAHPLTSFCGATCIIEGIATKVRQKAVMKLNMISYIKCQIKTSQSTRFSLQHQKNVLNIHQYPISVEFVLLSLLVHYTLYQSTPY